MSAAPTISVAKLAVHYGAFEAVSDVTFAVAAGEVFGLVGPNGAGKTSTLKVLAGLLPPAAGTATVAGCDVLTERDSVRQRIGYMADFFGVYDYLTVHEYLAFFGGMYGLAGEDLDVRIGEMLAAVTLAPKRHAPVRTLSRGMKQRLYLARALVHKPPVLILDEPASGLDPRGRAEMVATLRKAADGGTAVIISSHILDELQDLCHAVGVMEAGRLVGTRDLRAAAGVTRRVRLLTPVADRERAVAAATAMPAVTAAALTADAVLLEIAGGDDELAVVVARLVAAGVRVLLPPADTSDLKEVFLKMTTGELM
jgi:ABC-2 type transport system ATP-binding protein